MGYEWIEYKGKKILYVDYTQCKTKEEMLTMLDEMADVFDKSGGNVLSLTNFEGNYGSKEFMERARELSDVFRRNRKKSAVLGIQGAKKVLLQAYTLLTRDNMIPFESKERALVYLIRD
jgi:hypothetical protein